jgi:predicted O-methyltransferase YrrM
MKILLAITALLVAGCAAFFSVTGIGLLFHGATISVIVMASCLEVAKLVSAAHLKQAWKELGSLLRVYLTTAVVVLMVITSIGIYGFLSDAFQQQRIKIQQVDREIGVFDNKTKQNETEISRYTSQMNNLAGIRNSQEQNLSKLIDNNKSTARVVAMIKTADAQISVYSAKIDSLNAANTLNYQKIDDIKNTNIGLEKQVGGFRFVADALNVKIEVAVKWLILLIVIVFDPLAVALILAFVRYGKTTKKENMTEEMMFNNQDEVQFFLESLKLTDDVLEWGSGGSTIAIAKRVKSLYSIEHNKEWFDKVSGMIPENTHLFHIERNFEEKSGDDGTLEDYNDYVNFPCKLGKKFDVIFIDGRARVECARQATVLLKAGGIIFIHDYCHPNEVYRRYEYEVVEEFLVKTDQKFALAKFKLK